MRPKVPENLLYHACHNSDGKHTRRTDKRAGRSLDARREWRLWKISFGTVVTATPMINTLRRAAMIVAAAVVAIQSGSCRQQQKPPPAGTRLPVPSTMPFEVTPPAKTAAQSAQLIPLADAHEWITNGRVRVIDVRSADDYVTAHIPGAMHIPVSHIEGEISYIARDKPILTYCT